MTSAKKNSKKWSDEDIDNLIDLYEVNPCLWDIFDKSYQKRDVKEKALAAIAEELDVEINEIKGKWNAIRGQFGRELHKVKTSKSGQSADDLYVSQWVFWDKLQFLNKVMKTSTKRICFFIPFFVGRKFDRKNVNQNCFRYSVTKFIVSVARIV